MADEPNHFDPVQLAALVAGLHDPLRGVFERVGRDYGLLAGDAIYTKDGKLVDPMAVTT